MSNDVHPIKVDKCNDGWTIIVEGGMKKVQKEFDVIMSDEGHLMFDIPSINGKRGVKIFTDDDNIIKFEYYNDG
jgi:hypothetical protein